MKTIRLTFAYEGPEVSLLTTETLDMIPPPGLSGDDLENYNGFWALLKSNAGAPLARAVLHNPMEQGIEVFSPAGDIHMEAVEKPSGVFVVHLPYDASAGEVELFAPPADQGLERFAPAQSFAKFSLF